MSIPVISFVIQYAIVVPTIASMNIPASDLVSITLVGNVLPVISGGLLYGIPFWIASRAITGKHEIKKYLLIAAWGSIFLQLTSSGATYLAPYPPFGFVTQSFTAVACYLVLFGIYSSAVSISADSKLRQSIRKYAIEESKLFDDIAFANVTESIERKVLEIATRDIESIRQESGIYSSASEQDIKEYMRQVIAETKHAHKDRPQKQPSDTKEGISTE
jgi:hypothetical protein